MELRDFYKLKILWWICYSTVMRISCNQSGENSLLSFVVARSLSWKNIRVYTLWNEISLKILFYSISLKIFGTNIIPGYFFLPTFYHTSRSYTPTNIRHSKYFDRKEENRIVLLVSISPPPLPPPSIISEKCSKNQKTHDSSMHEILLFSIKHIHFREPR